MCGFLFSENVVDLLHNIEHRGVRSRVVGRMGHVRLPIVGIGEEYDQPIVDGQWTVAFVGEILDWRDEPSTYACDSDLALDMWVEEGAGAFTERDGFWSIAAWDSVSDELHLLCDYLAQKPTYYRTDVLAAASELTVLALAKSVTPDEIYFASVMKWGYCPEAQRTPFLEVKRVLPGEHVVLSEDSFSVRVSKEIVDPLVPLALDPLQLKEEIVAAVRRRVLSSDVPVAILLSGGLDSSIAYTLAKRFGSVRPYYVEGDQPDNMERLRVGAVAGDAEVVTANWTDVKLGDAMAAMQEPLDLGSLLPQVALAAAVKERACLTGDGADELFGGYGRSRRYDSQASDVWHELVCWHLPRLDRIMMRSLVEVRSPFLARRVAGAALALPRHERIGKKILRDLFRADLPPGVADAPKIPLRTPEVEASREDRSVELVEMFRSIWWPDAC